MRLTTNVPGLQSLTTDEMKDTNGGLLWLAVPILLLASCSPPKEECDKCQVPAGS